MKSHNSKHSAFTRMVPLLGLGVCLCHGPVEAQTEVPAKDAVTTPEQKSAIADDRFLLRLKPQAGQTYKVSMSLLQKTSQNMPQQRRFEMEQTIVIDYDCVIQGVDAKGNATMQIVFRRVKHSMDPPVVPGRKKVRLTYDSTRPSANKAPVEPFIKTIRALWGAYIGTGLTIQSSPTGKTLKVEGVDALVQKISNALAKDALIPKAELNRTLAELKKTYANGSMDGISQSWLFYPTNPVGIGDTWQQIASARIVGLPSPLDMNTTNILQSRENGVATIGVKSQFQFKDTLFQDKKQGIATILTCKGNQSGSYLAEESTGWPLSGEIDQRMTMHTQVVTTTRVNGKITKQIQTIPGYAKFHVSYKSHLTSGSNKN